MTREEFCRLKLDKSSLNLLYAWSRKQGWRKLRKYTSKKYGIPELKKEFGDYIYPFTVKQLKMIYDEFGAPNERQFVSD